MGKKGENAYTQADLKEIEYVKDISYQDKKLTITKEKIKVLATGDPYGNSSQDFNIE